MNDSEILTTHPFVLLAFGAEWCESCQSVKPVIEEVIKNLSVKIIIEEIDVDKSRALTNKNHVFSVPTLLLIRNGKEVCRINGSFNAAYLTKVLEKYVRASA